MPLCQYELGGIFMFWLNTTVSTLDRRGPEVHMRFFFSFPRLWLLNLCSFSCWSSIWIKYSRAGWWQWRLTQCSWCWMFQCVCCGSMKYHVRDRVPKQGETVPEALRAWNPTSDSLGLERTNCLKILTKGRGLSSLSKQKIDCGLTRPELKAFHQEPGAKSSTESR